MFLIQLMKKLKGYVTVKVMGKKGERFINLAMRMDVELWNIKREKDYLILNLSIAGYRKMWQQCRKENIPIKIIRKKGGPFLLHKLRKRKVFSVGLILFILVIYIISSFIWFVDVTGLETIDYNQFSTFLKEQNLKVGTFKYFIDTEKLEQNIKLAFPQIAWVSINVRGTQVLVEVVEKEGEEATEKGPANLIAVKDGVITKILVLSGQQEVNVGDTVAKNQLLISGQLFNEETRTHMLVRAFGIVEARVWYEGYGEALQQESLYKKTGNSVAVKYIEVFGKKIRISKKNIPYEKYSKGITVNRLAIKDSPLPFKVVIERYYEIKEEKNKYNITQMERLARERAIENAMKKVPDGVEIVNKTVNIIERSGKIVRVKVILETIEDIGKIQRINY
ncbi:sporulation protein YqfD [Anaerobranca gottschalkii]|uniref:Similar to stage IV sporulation protein n=1 Tax=Anaerobranca gottschalkii DSM 13577 TaxID=1120990 RepID=A0A1H9YCZ3_9FIRM|nr:sporulation protein YqfD [Anaerobranca gottschalkii]SES66789.1 similar to stage IV sporulation protein [Anaerobranca gottschalkii DSM 13577]